MYPIWSPISGLAKYKSVTINILKHFLHEAVLMHLQHKGKINEQLSTMWDLILLMFVTFNTGLIPLSLLVFELITLITVIRILHKMTHKVNTTRFGFLLSLGANVLKCSNFELSLFADIVHFLTFQLYDEGGFKYPTQLAFV